MDIELGTDSSGVRAGREGCRGEKVARHLSQGVHSCRNTPHFLLAPTSDFVSRTDTSPHTASCPTWHFHSRGLMSSSLITSKAKFLMLVFL